MYLSYKEVKKNILVVVLRVILVLHYLEQLPAVLLLQLLQILIYDCPSQPRCLT